MTTKKQKRLAGEAKQRELDAAHAAEVEFREKRARDRERKRQKRRMEQERRAQNIEASKRISGGMRPFVEPES